MKKLPARPTRDQLVAWKMQQGECGLLPQDFSVRCPKRGGPVNPNPQHPGMVGFPGGDGYSTCSKCSHFLGLELDSYVCTHPNARAVAARALAEAIRRWEEEQELQRQEPALPTREETAKIEPDEPDQAEEGQMTLF